MHPSRPASAAAGRAATAARALVPLLLPALLAGCGAAPVPGAGAEAPPGAIRLNQVGFYPGAPKRAVVAGAAGAGFQVLDARGEAVYEGELGEERRAPGADAATRLADFSELRAPGRYRLRVPGLGESAPFEIRPAVHDALARAAIKGFYFQRASTALEPRHAGAWSRPAGHPDTSVLVHPSAASPGRPAGTVIAAPGGWYDAGDYNKYIVNSGITTATLLALHEDFPDYAAGLELEIPESGDAVPDLLQEALWNLRWMLAMQDPGDGGVYHKLTTPRFEGFVPPAEARGQRYVVRKSTAAALDFAAVMAQAGRVLRPFDAALADSAVAAATRAWGWARRHPDVVYDQGRLNERHDPDIETGAYGDRDLADELAWAAVELAVTTGQDSFYTAVPVFPEAEPTVPNWRRVETLGHLAMVRHGDRLPGRAAADLPRAERRLVELADRLVERAGRSPNGTVMGGDPGDFVWGSNAVAANQGMILVRAYRLTGERRYLEHALGNLDYILGRNATGYAFVTGHGARTPLHPHHRLSETDAAEAPVPGLLAGGPNPGRQDGCAYPDTVPELAYIDDVCSYASNEIAINWNAPLAYLAAALEALRHEAGWSADAT